MANAGPPRGPAGSTYAKASLIGPKRYQDPIDPDELVDGPVDQDIYEQTFHKKCLRTFIMAYRDKEYANVLRRIRSLPVSWSDPYDIRRVWNEYKLFTEDKELIRDHSGFTPAQKTAFVSLPGRKNAIKQAIQQCEREAAEYTQHFMHSRATPPSSPLSRLQLSSHTLDILQELHSRIEALEAYL